MVALHTLKNIGEQSCWKEHNGTVTLLEVGQGCFSLPIKRLNRPGESLPLLVRVFCIYLYNTRTNFGCEQGVGFSAQEST